MAAPFLNTPVLRLTGVDKYFVRGTVDEVRALAGVDLALEEGDFVTVVGSNGAGKSTLLDVVCGNQLSDGGSIAIDGRDVTSAPVYVRAQSIGRVNQDPRSGSAPNLTVEQNMALALLRGAKRGLGTGVTTSRREHFREVLKPFGLGLEERLSAPAGTLSGGQRQALSLALAKLVPPRLLLLDEHTAALDARVAPIVLELTRALVEGEHMTSLMVTHNLEHAIFYGNRLVMMHAGRLVLDIAGEQKRSLTVHELVARFEEQAAQHLTDDTLLLSG
jgi:putative ABC transport system ATP-binding protein